MGDVAPDGCARAAGAGSSDRRARRPDHRERPDEDPTDHRPAGPGERADRARARRPGRSRRPERLTMPALAHSPGATRFDRWLLTKEWKRSDFAAPPSDSELRAVQGDGGVPLLGHSLE